MSTTSSPSSIVHAEGGGKGAGCAEGDVEVNVSDLLAERTQLQRKVKDYEVSKS